MLKKEITYVDHDGTTQTKDFLFNLTKAEAVEINLMEDLETVGNSANPKAIIPVFKRIIHYAYGVKAPNGQFDKDPERTAGFLASDAYSELFLELLQNGETGVTDFIRAVVGFTPEELAKAQADVAAGRNPDAPAPQDYKKSARELAEEARQVPSPPVEVVAADPSVQTGQSLEEKAQYQQFLDWQAAQKQGEEDVAVSHNVFEFQAVEPEETVPNIIETETVVPTQRLRRDPAERYTVDQPQTFDPSTGQPL